MKCYISSRELTRMFNGDIAYLFIRYASRIGAKKVYRWRPVTVHREGRDIPMEKRFAYYEVDTLVKYFQGILDRRYHTYKNKRIEWREQWPEIKRKLKEYKDVTETV